MDLFTAQRAAENYIKLKYVSLAYGTDLTAPETITVTMADNVFLPVIEPGVMAVFKAMPKNTYDNL